MMKIKMNLKKARTILAIIVNPNDLLGVNRSGNKYYLCVRQITGDELEIVQRYFNVTHLLGENDTYGDIMITMEAKKEVEGDCIFCGKSEAIKN